jgi:hypothetical protein
MPIRIHPANPKLFEFRGKPIVLLTATEHYGAVMNRPFRFERYLEDAAEKGMTLSRLFVLFREQQSSMNPYSTCKPESPDFIAPFERTGPGTACDGQPRFDLDRSNPEFYERLHRFLSLASDYGIIVEVTLLSNTYGPGVWALNPLHHCNNVNGLPEIAWPEYMSMRYAPVFERQIAHVRRIVAETKRYDNVIYEICNEPGGCAPGNADHPTPAEVNAWEAEIARAIREADNTGNDRHLVSGQEAFTYEPWEQSSDRTFGELDIDVVNMHPLPGTTYRGDTWDMGQFMSKQLKLRAVRDFCLATSGEHKPLNLDEDNVASQYKDFDGWTIHRKRAWTTLLCGAHYDYIDFSIINYCEAGTEASRRCVRTWFGHLSRFVHSFDLARAKPLSKMVSHSPAHALVSAFGVAGEDVCVYLADERELTDDGCGEPIGGSVSLRLPEGRWTASCFSPETGMYSPAVEVASGALDLRLPEFRHDLAVRLRRAG